MQAANRWLAEKELMQTIEELSKELERHRGLFMAEAIQRLSRDDAEEIVQNVIGDVVRLFACNPEKYAELTGSKLKYYALKAVRSKTTDFLKKKAASSPYVDSMGYLNHEARRTVNAEPVEPRGTTSFSVTQQAAYKGRGRLDFNKAVADAQIGDIHKAASFTVWQDGQGIGSYVKESMAEYLGRGGVITQCPFVEPTPDQITFRRKLPKSNLAICRTWGEVLNPLEALLRKEWRSLEAKIPHKQREVVHARVYEELSYKQIATLLGISAHTVRNHLADARKKYQEFSLRQ